MIARNKPKLKKLGWKVDKAEEIGGALYSLVRSEQREEFPLEQPILPTFIEPRPTAERIEKQLEGEKIGRVLIKLVPATVLEKPTEKEQISPRRKPQRETEFKRPYVKDSIIPDFYERKPRTVALPNGRTIEVDSAWPFYLTQYINEGVNTVNEIARRIFGEDNKQNRGRVSAAVAGVNRVLSNFDTGFSIKNVTPVSKSHKGDLARYEWKENVSGKILVVGTKPQDKIQEVVEVPYEPSPDEIRTADETKVVDTITAILAKSQKIDFSLLQRALRTDARIQRIHGQQMYRPYQADELKRLFELGLRKLKDESTIPRARLVWREEDVHRWEIVQGQIERLTQENDFDEYIRLVKRLIDISQKTFGIVPEWIDVGKL